LRALPGPTLRQPLLPSELVLERQTEKRRWGRSLPPRGSPDGPQPAGGQPHAYPLAFGVEVKLRRLALSEVWIRDVLLQNGSAAGIEGQPGHLIDSV
jgi:hypothetical protein